MARKKKYKIKSTDHGHPPVRTIDLINQYIASKLPRPKEPVVDVNKSMMTGASAQINHLAIILDGNVEEVMRAQNRLAALLLSSPEFVEFDPNEGIVSVGDRFEDGKFIKTQPDHHHHDEEETNANQEDNLSL